MKWTLYSKWIELNRLSDIEASFFHECILVGKKANGNDIGLAAFAPRDINQTFIDKIIDKKNSGVFERAILYLPPFLRHRCEELMSDQFFSEFLEIIYSPFINIIVKSHQLHIRSKVRVLNVDDSSVLLKFLKSCIEELPWVELIGQVQDSTQAKREIITLCPDVVTLDIQMPQMNGVQVLEQVLAERYLPIIMVSSVNLEEGSQVFGALMKGAFDYLQKPALSDRGSFVKDLSEKLMAAIQGKNAQSALRQMDTGETRRAQVDYADDLIWCFGASTGGTQALTKVFTSFPTHIPPTFIVQHIPPLFSQSFAKSLDSLCPFHVKEAEDGEIAISDTVYIAPGGKQMKVYEQNKDLYIKITDDSPVNRFKPSVDYLFDSLSKLKGKKIISSVLTGMGKDGAQGLLQLRNANAITLAQDEATSTVYGMPRAAAEIGATNMIVPLYEIASEYLMHSRK